MLTPSVIWFMICSEYFPRSGFAQKDIPQSVKETFNKIKDIVPDFPQRITKANNKPESTQKFASDALESLLIESFSQGIKYYAGGSMLSLSGKSLSTSSARAPNPVVKANYGEEDDQWLMETRRYIYDSFKKMQKESLLPVLNYDITQNLDLLSKIDLQDLISLYEKELYEVLSENEKRQGQLEKTVTNTLMEEEMINSLEFDPNDPVSDIKLTFPEDEKFIALMERRQNDAKPSNNEKKPGTGQEGMKTLQKSRPETKLEDMVCQICNDGDYTDDNLIVFCSVSF